MVSMRMMVLTGMILMLSAGAFAAEFGDSVKFDKSMPSISMENLQGKVALFIFFQSW